MSKVRLTLPGYSQKPQGVKLEKLKAKDFGKIYQSPTEQDKKVTMRTISTVQPRSRTPMAAQIFSKFTAKPLPKFYINKIQDGSYESFGTSDIKKFTQIGT